MCNDKFQRNSAAQSDIYPYRVNYDRYHEASIVLVLKNQLTLGTAEVKRHSRLLAIVPWLQIAFLPFKVTYKVQFQICLRNLQNTLNANIKKESHIAVSSEFARLSSMLPDREALTWTSLLQECQYLSP